MNASCKCSCGHQWSTAVIENDPTINSLVLEDDHCPACGSLDFTVADITTDYYEDEL